MTVFSVVFPIFIIIIFGFFLKRYFILSTEFWINTDRLIYFFLMPMMLVQVLAQAKFDPQMLLKGLTIFTVVSVMAFLTFLFRRLMAVTDREFTSVFQGIVRVNFYMSLSLASQLYGAEGVQFLSYLLVFLIPSATIFSVIVLQKYGSGSTTKNSFKIIISRLTKNPIIIATFLGLALGYIGGLPKLFDETLGIFSRATLPLALLGIGASLEFKSLKAAYKALIASVFLRLIAAPMLCLMISISLEFNKMEALCCLFIFAVPTAASAISFANQMGGDAKLMSSILTLQTLTSFATLAAWISIVQYLF